MGSDRVRTDTRGDRQRQSVSRRRLVFALLCASVLFGLTAARAAVLPLAARHLDVGAAPRRVDCVMALPGDAERRPFVAAALANVGLTDTLLIPKNEDSPDVIDQIFPSSAEMARRIYLSRGVAANRVVVLEGATDSTAGDLGLLGNYLDNHPRKTAGVVTSGFHTRRTQWTIREQLPQHASRITVFSAPNPRFNNATWWRSNQGFRYVVLEYLKLCYYWFRYGRGVYWVCALAVLSVIWRLRPRLIGWRRKMSDNIL